MTDCLIYRRFSTDEQETGLGETLTRQLERCQAFAVAQGWNIIGEPLTDKGRSAFKGDGDEQALTMISKLKAEIDRLKADLADANTQVALASGKVSDVEHLRRVADVRDAAMSPDDSIRLPARIKLRSAFASIVQQVDVERDDDGEKVFTVILLGGVMAVRIDTKGKLKKAVSDALGRPLWTFLTPDQQTLIAPLIQRIEKMAAR